MEKMKLELTREEAESLEKLLRWYLEDATMLKPENRQRMAILEKLEARNG